MQCTVAGGLGALVTLQRALSCVHYRPDGVTEFYTGSSSRLGLAIGATNAVRFAFHVAGADPSALDGGFGGPGANAAITGVDLSAGLTMLTLHDAGRETLSDRRRDRYQGRMGLGRRRDLSLKGHA